MSLRFKTNFDGLRLQSIEYLCFSSCIFKRTLCRCENISAKMAGNIGAIRRVNPKRLEDSWQLILKVDQ